MASIEKALSLLPSSISRPTLYSVELGLPRNNTLMKISREDTKETNEYISMFARTASIPEVAIDTESILGQDDQGVMRNTPIATKFVGNRFTLDIIENSDFTTYKYFKELMQITGQVKGTNPIGSNNYGNRVVSSRAQRMNFYNNYVFPATITKLEFPGSAKDWRKRAKADKNTDIVNSNSVNFGYKVVAKYDFRNCFVTSISPITLNSEGFNQALSFQVSINFETYEYVPFNVYNVEFEEKDD